MCKIEFEIPKAGYVTVKVVDIIGKPVKSLINSHKEAGRHMVDFNNEELAPGKYYYKVILSENEKIEIVNDK
jgi:hypothetical protein